MVQSPEFYTWEENQLMKTALRTQNRLRIGLLLLAYVAFISLGLPDGLLGVAWPSMRIDFDLPLDALGLLLIAFMAGYLTSSFFNGGVISRLGVGGLLAASCFATGAALIGYTLAPAWWLIVGLGVVAGMGAGAIDAGINTYIAANYGEGLMQWLHASFGLGVTLGPIIMTAGLNLYSSWRFGYIVVGSAQLLLALTFAISIPLWKREQSSRPSADAQRLTDYRTPLLATLRRPAAWLSILMFFLYTGSELTLGHWAYTLLTESRGVDPSAAGLWAGGYWGTFTLGRLLGGVITRRLGGHNLLRLSMLSALAGAILLWWNPFPIASLIAVTLVGFAIAPIFPGLVSGTSQRVGPEHAANTIGMQISAAGIGGTALPALAGSLARYTSLESIPIFLTGLFVALFFLYTLATRRVSTNG